MVHQGWNFKCHAMVSLEKVEKQENFDSSIDEAKIAERRALERNKKK